MKIRIAQKGWSRDYYAKTLEDVIVGLALPWVELDGHRIDRELISAEFHAQEDGFTIPRLTVEIGAAVELVYLGEDGEPLGPAVEVGADLLAAAGPINADTMIQRNP